MAEKDGMAFMPLECPANDGIRVPFDESAIHIRSEDVGQDGDGNPIVHETLVSIHGGDYDAADGIAALMAETVPADSLEADSHYMAEVRGADFASFICQSIKACTGAKVINGELLCGAVNRHVLEAQLYKYYSEAADVQQ
jgi:hypothetical protein